MGILLACVLYVMAGGVVYQKMRNMGIRDDDAVPGGALWPALLSLAVVGYFGYKVLRFAAWFGRAVVGERLPRAKAVRK